MLTIGNMNALGFGGSGAERLLKLFEIPDLTQVSGGYFVGSGVQIQAAQTTNPNDSLIMPANNTSIINAVTLAGCYSQFYTTDSTPKTVLLSDIYLTNDQVIKSGNYLTLLPNPYQRNFISTLMTDKSLKRATVNLCQDGGFSETTKLTDRVNGKLVWWEEYLPYGGTNGDSVEYLNDTVLLNGRRYFYLKLNPGTVASSPSTYVKQNVYLNGISKNSKISISCWFKTSIVNGAELRVWFYDKFANPVGSTIGINIGNTSNVWTYKKFENISIPISATAITFFQFRLASGGGNAPTYISQPVVNIGETASYDFENIYDEYEGYSGIERFVNKCVFGSSVNVALHGDSITRSGDITQNAIASQLGMFLNYEIPRLFGNIISVRNNSADGTNHILQHSILKKMALDHGTDLIFLQNGRNLSPTYDDVPSRYIMEETDVVSILNDNIDTDIILSLPSYQRLQNPIDPTLVNGYNRDLTLIEQNNTIKSRYNIAKMYSAEKIKAWADATDTTMTWNDFYNDVTHPIVSGHYIRHMEVRRLIAKALRYVNNRVSLGLSINQLLSLTPTTLYPSNFGVTEGTVKSGIWVNDPAVTMNNGSFIAGSYALGEYDQPIVSSAQGDYLEVTWTGKHFAIMFIPTTTRGIANVIIDGTTYEINTKRAITSNYIPICTYSNSSLNLGISLSEGEHTLKIEQKNATANDKISIALVTVF